MPDLGRAAREPRPHGRRLPGRSPRGRWLLAWLFIVAQAACSADPEPAPISDPEFEGLSREEIERQAESMTLEEAERLGIVDTTIRIESPMNPDSVILIPIDTSARP